MSSGKYSRRAFLAGVLATGTLTAAAVSQVPGGVATPTVRLRYTTATDSTGAHHFLVNTWNYAHPDTPIDLHEVGGSTNDQQREMAREASIADVLNLDMVHIPYFAQRNLIQKIEVEPSVIQEFIDITLRACLWNMPPNSRQYWAVPFNTDAGVLFQRLGTDTDAPSIGLSRAINQLKDGSHGFAGQLAPPSSSQWEGFVVNVLEHALSNNPGILNEMTGMPLYDLAAWQVALEPLKAANRSGRIDRCADEGETTDHFVKRRLKYMRNWPSRYRDLQNEDDVDVRASRIRINPLPTGILGGQCLALTHDSNNPSRARGFIDFLTSEPAQNVAAAHGLLAARSSVYQGDSNLTALIPNLAQLKGVVENARPRPIHENHAAFSDVVVKYVGPFLEPDSSDLPKHFVDEMRKALQ